LGTAKDFDINDSDPSTIQTSVKTLLNHRYRLLQILGSGGFGQTFLAVDTHLPSQRKCAIKQLKPIMQAPEKQQWLQDRFHREASILEALGESHPQFPRLYAYFAEAGTFYLVQEYIEGVTLTQKVERDGLLGEDEVAEILVRLLSILDRVHSQRMVHRDVKPDNIILRATDGQPVLIDFGAVKEAMGTVVNRYGSVKSSIAIGTPGYMPPEQAAGRPLYSSDLYGLALTAVFLLSGKTPQALEVDADAGEILWRRELPDLHCHLAGVLDRALRYHPRDRFATAAMMLAALQSRTVPSTPVRRTALSRFPALASLSGPTLATLAVPPPLLRQGRNLPAAFLGGFVALAVGAASANLWLDTTEPLRPVAFPVLSPPTPALRNSSAIAIFVPGTPQEKVLDTLGKPTYIRRGYYPNTRAVAYNNYIPGKVNLGYIFDKNTGQLRQTEVSLARSLQLELMQATLTEMLANSVSSETIRALQEVYRGRSESHSFQVGLFKGTIQAEGSDRIYIAVWEAPFH
jgi:serine/threonine protein kinase, bacterial